MMGIIDELNSQLVAHIKASWPVYLVVAAVLFVAMNPLRQSNLVEIQTPVEVVRNERGD